MGEMKQAIVSSSAQDDSATHTQSRNFLEIRIGSARINHINLRRSHKIHNALGPQGIKILKIW